MVDDSRRRFELKGKKAEEFLHELATRSFFTDWCYPNAVLGPGKECDLLVVFDDIVIIWQVKDLKLDENGKYSEKEVQKNLRQLAGARRALLDLKAPITLTNPRRGAEVFDPTTVKRVFLISGLLGELQDFGSLLDEAKSHAVHVFTRGFTELALTELDTIRDFTAYLEKKGELLFSQPERHVILEGGEEEILALYILNNRTIPVLEQPAILVNIQEGHWEDLQERPEYIERKELDQISYLWDEMIDRAHTSGSPDYERVARELARLNRFQRRCAAKSFMDAWERADAAEGHVFRRTTISEDVTLCFLFADETVVPGEARREMLAAQCFVTRGLPQAVHNPTVIGVATEKVMGETCSYDFACIRIPEWTDELQLEADELKSRFGLMKAPSAWRTHEREYPERAG